MANTTDIMITTLFDDGAIEFINKETGLDLEQFSDGEKAGGSKVLAFEVFGTCARGLGKSVIEELIEVFKKAPFNSPKYAMLFIDDDNGDFNGVIPALDKQKGRF